MRKRGFTLVEVLVVTGIFALLALLTSSFIISSLKNYRIKNQSIEEEERAATVMREFEQNIRAATKVESIGQNEITYYRFYDATSAFPTRVRYFLDSGQFKVATTKPSGTAPNVVYLSSDETVDLVIDDVVNTMIFSYFNNSNAEVTNYAELPTISMIRLDIKLDKNPGLPPASIEESTMVSLRNMKTNL